MKRLTLFIVVFVSSVVGSTPARAGQSPAAGDVVVRDSATGKVTIRVTRLDEPLRIDGRLDEEMYSNIPPVSDFVQMEPDGGQPASEKTEVWVSFDQRNIYVSMRAWESHPERMIANEMRRDSNNIRQGDCVGFSFDTFFDHRNALQFEVSPIGARTDGQSTNERQYSADWNPVWDVAVGKFEGGWTVEAAIPFKSIRYAAGPWGFQARRNNKWKNEISYLTAVPPAFGIGRGSFSASLFATLTGLEVPDRSRNLEVKPYVVGNMTTDKTVAPVLLNHPDGDLGADAKYGVTQSLSADLTYNTDFAQVEADEQQVNLTRFSLFFPEKRDFFLENQGIFTFGGAGVNSAAAGATSSGGGAVPGDSGETPQLFYSRRIGLNGSKVVPIWGGGRLTGRVGRTTLGLINMETRDDALSNSPATNFSVVRVKRDILGRSSIGLLATNRSTAQAGNGSNQVVGIDTALAFFSNVAVNAYFAKATSAGTSSDDFSYRTQFDYGGDRYGLALERLSVGSNFNPDIGFVRRSDIRRNYALARFSPRSRRIKTIRKYYAIGQFTYTNDGAGRLNTRIADGDFSIEFQNSDRVDVGLNDDYEFAKTAFPVIISTVRLPSGGYHFRTGRVGYNFGQQRPYSGSLLFEKGSYYSGDRTTITLRGSRLNVTPQFSVEPNFSVNSVDVPVPGGSFTAKLLGPRVTYTMTPLMFASALIQFNSSTDSVSANVRLRWEYRPGSELFVVFNEERDTLARNFPATRNRAVIFKVNRFFRL
jgi:uncharacterized protein DUF5916